MLNVKYACQSLHSLCSSQIKSTLNKGHSFNLFKQIIYKLFVFLNVLSFINMQKQFKHERNN